MVKFSFPQNAAFPFLTKKNTFKGFITLLAVLSLFWSACQKPKIKDDIRPSKLSTMSDRVASGIQFSDIMAKLPQTVMYELGDSVRFYTGKYESMKTDSTLAVRIPTTLDGNHYVYAVRSFNNPADLKVYLVQFIPDRGSVPERYTGQQIWLDVQDWHIYGTTYKNNIPTQQLKPIQLAEPGWEDCMIENGYFSIGDNGNLLVSDNPTVMGGDCHDPIKPQSPSSFKNFTRAIGNLLGSLFTEGSDNTGGILEWPREWYGSGGSGAGGPSAGGGGSSNNWTPNGTIGNGPAMATNGFEGNSGVTPNTNTAAAFLVNFLVNHSQPLTQNEVNWLVFHNAPDAIQMQQYILGPTPGVTLNQKAGIIKEHISMMLTNINYCDFVNNYKQNNTGMWWMNDSWLNNPINNFQLSPNSTYNQFKELTAAEKKLVTLFPIQAYVISKNKGVAFQYAQSSGFTQAHNGKQDAFRHCFFQAINTRDVYGRYWGFPSYSSAQIVELFSDAHESETPLQLHLEKDMDLYNNGIGINIGIIHPLSDNNAMASEVSSKITSGLLKYLKPLDINENIIPGQTQIYFTNQ